MAENQANQAALQAFWNQTAPMSQVRENLNPPNGQYDLLVNKLEPAQDDKGMVYIDAEFVITAPSSVAQAKVGNTFRPRLYVGSGKDPLAQLPETLLSCNALRVLKGIARVTQTPCNDQAIGALCAALLNKTFSNRIETKKVKDKVSGEEKEYCNFGRNPSPVGVIPARLDSEGTAAAPVAQNGNAQAIAGAAFGAE